MALPEPVENEGSPPTLGRWSPQDREAEVVTGRETTGHGQPLSPPWFGTGSFPGLKLRELVRLKYLVWKHDFIWLMGIWCRRTEMGSLEI